MTMTLPRFSFLLPACLGLLAVLPAHAASSDSRWVQTAWQEVKAAPDATAAIVTHWPANTAVSLGRQEGEWCQATSEKGESGFVPCKALAETPLTLETLYTRWAGKGGDVVDDQLTFWAAPSVARFVQAGINFNYHALTAQQEGQQTRTRTPVRFILPKFEAMKKRLRQNVMPRIEQEVTRVDMETFVPLGPAPNPYRNDRAAYLKRFLKPAMLPVAKPSLFKQHTDVLLWGDASSDAITAMQGQVGKISFTGKPQWVDGRHDQGVESIWDIGQVDVRFARPAPLVAISYDGLVEVRLIAGMQTGGSRYDEDCAEGYPVLITGKFVPGYPRVKERLIAFYLPDVPAAKKVEVLTRKKQAAIPENDYSPDAPLKLTDVLVRSIDLDQDGIPDLSIMETPGAYGMERPEPDRYFFINVGGRWWYAGMEISNFCT